MSYKKSRRNISDENRTDGAKRWLDHIAKIMVNKIPKILIRSTIYGKKGGERPKLR